MQRSSGNVSWMLVALALNSFLAISVRLDMARLELLSILERQQLPPRLVAGPLIKMKVLPKNKVTRTMHMLWLSNFRKRNNARTQEMTTLITDKPRRLTLRDGDRVMHTTGLQARCNGVIPANSHLTWNIANLNGPRNPPNTTTSHRQRMNRQLEVDSSNPKDARPLHLRGIIHTHEPNPNMHVVLRL